MIHEGSGPPPFEGVEEWLELVDEALQGLHHALNNRIGSLSAIVELYQLGELPSDGSGFETLAADLTRLGDCNRIVRLLRRDTVPGDEPLILDDVLADVFAICISDNAASIILAPPDFDITRKGTLCLMQ